MSPEHKNILITWRWWLWELQTLAFPTWLTPTRVNTSSEVLCKSVFICLFWSICICLINPRLGGNTKVLSLRCQAKFSPGDNQQKYFNYWLIYIISLYYFLTSPFVWYNPTLHRVFQWWSVLLLINLNERSCNSGQRSCQSAVCYILSPDLQLLSFDWLCVNVTQCLVEKICSKLSVYQSLSLIYSRIGSSDG